MSIKKKIHHLISGQIPEFVRAEHPQFVKFLEYYYKFLEQASIGALQLPGVNHAILNSEDWRDIDKTLDLFIPYYRSQFTYDIPSNTIIDNRRLLKYINQYYEGKGSENSTEIFFRFMFNDTVSVVYPGDYILRTSDGRWRRKKFIKVETTNFLNNNIYELIGKTITLRYTEYIAGAGTFIRTVTTRCFDVFESSRPNIFQLEVDINPNYIFPDYIIADTTLAPSLGNYDTHVYVQKIEGVSTTTYGTISKQIVGVVSIDDPGSNFARDDSYFISETGVEGSYFAATGSNRYVTNLTGPSAYVYELLQNNAVVRIRETRNRLSEQYFLQDYTIYGNYASAPVRGLLHQLAIIDTGEKFLVRSDTTDGLGFTGTPIKTFTVELQPRRSNGSEAVITFRTGHIYHAPGEYKDNSGFLSDIVKLQDNDYYQPYSYVVRTTKPLNEWKETYLESSHPAGFKLFSELNLTGNINVYPAVNSNITSIIINDAGSIAFNTLQGITDVVSLQTSLPFEETLVTSETFSTNLAFSLPLLEEVSTTETISIDYEKSILTSSTISENFQRTVIAYNLSFDDSISITESTTYDTFINPSETISLEDVFVNNFQQIDDSTSILLDNISVTDTIGLHTSKIPNEFITVSDNYLIQYNKNNDEIVTSSETVTVSINKPISETVTIVDTYSNVFNQSNTLDTLSTSETISLILVIPVDLNDTQNITDIVTVEAKPLLADVSSTSETITFDVNTTLSDSTTATDTFQFSFSQNNDVNSVLLDEVTFSETITFTYAEIISDTVTVSNLDTITVNYGLNPSDISTTTDTISYSLNVPFNNDEIISTDIVTKSVSVVPSIDTVSNTDTININSNIELSDTQTLQDVGGEYFIESYFEGHENSLSPYVNNLSRYVGTTTNF